MAQAVEGPQALAHVKCKSCGARIPLYSLEKPINIECPTCGNKGVIK